LSALIGVDIGGTFTDLVVHDDQTNQIIVAKGPTMPDSIAEGVGRLVKSAIPNELLRRAAFFLHGTTVGLNTLIEHKGAKLSLLATEGFRDLLEMRRGERDSMYDLRWKLPEPLVPRRLRLPVTERVGSDGSVLTPLSEESVLAAVKRIREEAVECVAVAFINAYANPEHELAAERILREAGFEGEIALSHRISGEYREYERTSTTVVDAYVRPRVTHYLQELDSILREQGFTGQSLVTRSGGGAIPFVEAEARPVETIMSGPAAGAVGAGELCRRLEIGQGITADVGGTSFDTCLILDARPEVKYEGRVGGMHLQTPWVDVRSIGAGGGSLAYVDAGGLLRVGPESAGAAPGPACYGRGGTLPTVTDAAAVLGMLAFGDLAGGVTLDIDAARKALSPLAEQLSFEVDDVARGVLTIANSAMAQAIRSVTVEQGRDPRISSLLAYGGAGPMFGTLLARELGIGQVVVPEQAGNFSARSLLGQDLTRSVAVTAVRALDDDSIESANETLRSLYAELADRGGSADGNGNSETTLRPALDIRYAGQEYTLTVHPPSEDGLIGTGSEAVRDQFTRDYERTFGHRMDEPLEIVSLRAESRAPLGRVDLALPATNGDHADAGAEPPTIDAYSFTTGERMPFKVVNRAALPVGTRIPGPMIVLEPTTTTYVDAEFDVEVHPAGPMVLIDREAGR
jgi:N-methylhydantoinase A